MSQRLALLIGNSEYNDERLVRLKNPVADVGALADVLRIPEIGGFDDVQMLLNENDAVVRRAIADFFSDKTKDDLLLLYFSGHGVLDPRGRLFLALKDTIQDRLSATAVGAQFINEEMDECHSRRQVLVLDCCNSGAFDRKYVKGGEQALTQQTFMGRGKVVLTASSATEYAWEGSKLVGESLNSVFTYHLLQGLETGQADLNQDGNIDVHELFEYLYKEVKSTNPRQTPHKWVYGEQGNLVIARNPHFTTPEPQIAAEESWVVAVQTLIEIAGDMANASNQHQAIEVYRRALSLCPVNTEMANQIYYLINKLEKTGQKVNITRKESAIFTTPKLTAFNANENLSNINFQLVFQSGPKIGTVCSIDAPEVFIGRDLNNDIVINDPEISRRHARLFQQGNAYVVEDLGSTLGTQVNGQRIVSKFILSPGDVISFGKNTAHWALP